MNDLSTAINLLGAYCGMRDIPELTPDALAARCGDTQADVMVLFGGSILAGADLLAEAMQRGTARRYVIVGGAGHTTQTLRDLIHTECPAIDTAGQPEAVILDAYLRQRYGLTADLLETASTNCGNNITNLLALLEAHAVPCRSIILTQDASMQRRMDAGLRRHRPDLTIINFAAYRAEVVQRGGDLSFAKDIHGMWDMERYISLLLGEIPRLRDDADGYGPCGKGYIAHVEIPTDVLEAFAAVREHFPHLVRGADPRYASK